MGSERGREKGKNVNGKGSEGRGKKSEMIPKYTERDTGRNKEEGKASGREKRGLGRSRKERRGN